MESCHAQPQVWTCTSVPLYICIIHTTNYSQDEALYYLANVYWPNNLNATKQALNQLRIDKQDKWKTWLYIK